MSMKRGQHFEHKCIVPKNLRKCFGKCVRKVLFREIEYDHSFLVHPTLVCDIPSERSEQVKIDQKKKSNAHLSIPEKKRIHDSSSESSAGNDYDAYLD